MPMRWSFSFVIHLAFFTLCLGAVNGSFASDDSRFSEYEIKGAFLYKFAKFTEWPKSSFPDSTTPITICVFGDDPFGDILDSLKNIQVHGRPLSIKKSKEIDALKECHVVFICASEKKRSEEVLDKLKGFPVLTVGEMEGFARKDGIINFVTTGKKVQFEVNLDAVGKSGLKIGSQLLVVARIVRP